MENDAGEKVDMYVPRKCSWTNRILTRMDRGAVQINVGHVDPNTGMYTGSFTPVALSGFVRGQGEADLALSTIVAGMENKWPLPQNN